MSLFVTPRQLNQRAELYHQIGLMLTAGLSVHKSLEHLAEHPPSYSLRTPVLGLLEHLNGGATLTEAFRLIGKWIPSFDIALIEAAERSGRLDACFKLLAIYYRERAQMIRQMISDLAYPLFLFHFAVLLFPLVNLLTGWLGGHPNFLSFFLTVALILGPIYGAVFVLVYACQGRHGEIWRSQLEGILAPIPILGTARKYLALGRLATALESLLNAGVPIVQAWELAATASGSPAISRTVQTWRAPLENGATISELVSQSGQFPDLFANLYHTGEVSGQLDETLVRLHNLYQSEGLTKMRLLSQWTPKIVYFGIMLYVAYKIISYYSGYFNQMNQIIDGK